MTADEFASGYAERSGLTLEQFYALSTIRPCSCDYEECEGWQALSYERAGVPRRQAVSDPRSQSGRR